MHKRDHRRIGLWATLAILASLIYPLSFFPACWVYTRLDGWRIQSGAGHSIAWAYRPLLIVSCESPDSAQTIIARLIDLGAADTQAWFLQDPDLHGLILDRPGYTFTLRSYDPTTQPVP